MAKDPVQLNVGSGSSFHLERQGAQQYAIVNDADSKTVAVFNKDQPLELTGEGKNVTLRISAVIGLAADEPAPMIKVSTKHQTVDEDKEGVTILGPQNIIAKKQAAQREGDKQPETIIRDDQPSVSQQEADYALKHNVLGFSPAVLEAAIQAARNSETPNTNYVNPNKQVAEADQNNIQVPGGIPNLFGGPRSVS